jgi:hypothetical protein
VARPPSIRSMNVRTSGTREVERLLALMMQSKELAGTKTHAPSAGFLWLSP